MYLKNYICGNIFETNMDNLIQFNMLCNTSYPKRLRDSLGNFVKPFYRHAALKRWKTELHCMKYYRQVQLGSTIRRYIYSNASPQRHGKNQKYFSRDGGNVQASTGATSLCIFKTKQFKRTNGVKTRSRGLERLQGIQ